MRQSVYELNVGGIALQVTRKRVKNLRIAVVPPDGTVKATAPFSLSDDRIIRFVESRREWIVDQRRSVIASPASRAERASDAEIAQWKAVVASCVPVLVSEWAPVLGVGVRKLDYRNMKSRWGSCQPSTGRVCINVRLALYPPECLEYVVVHELCHFLVPNHGPEFKELMGRLMPDWKERAAKLR